MALRNLLGHERYIDGFLVEGRCHFCSFSDVSAVHEPEASTDGGGEVDAVVDEGERRRTGDILPLCTGSSTCHEDHLKNPPCTAFERAIKLSNIDT